VALSYYLFVNHGTPPSVVADMSDREVALCWQMALKEMKSRNRK
jgi:hypothetical protein